jgi:hypothetical protein
VGAVVVAELDYMVQDQADLEVAVTEEEEEDLAVALELLAVVHHLHMEVLAEHMEAVAVALDIMELLL